MEFYVEFSFVRVIDYFGELQNPLYFHSLSERTLSLMLKVRYKSLPKEANPGVPGARIAVITAEI